MRERNVLTLAGIAFAAAFAAMPGLSHAQGIPAETRLHRNHDVEMAFIRPGLIWDVLVTEGQRVSKDQVLVKLDDRAEQIQLEQIKQQSENEVQIEAAVAQRDQSEVDLKRTIEMKEQGAATELEVQHAELQLLIDRLKLKLARFQQDQDRMKYREAKAQMDRMRLVSPIDGVVEAIYVKPGMSVNQLEKVIRVVNVDPLVIDVDVPIHEAKSLETGQKATVMFEDRPQTTESGRVIFKALSAQGAIPPTLRVTVELANGNGRPAGERVYVSFPALEAPVAEADASEPPTEAADRADSAEAAQASADRSAPSQ